MKNKKIIIAVVLLCVLGVAGASLAYFNTTDQISNAFRTRNYRMEVIESFSSPDNWAPGDTTPKTVKAVNKGNVDVAVRISFIEEWKDAEGNTLPLKYNGTDYASIINFANDYDTYWTKKTQNSVDYYYYKYKLGKQTSTVSLIDSVTFNPSITSELTHNCSQDNSTNTQVCSTRSSGYVGGTYKLTIKIETIDYDLFDSEWNADIELGNPPKIVLTNRINSLVGKDYIDNTDPDNNIRYIGSNPSNYVMFNDELWRIIGVFDGRVKIIRNESIGTYSWDASDSSINYGYGVNEWSQSDIKEELNGDYLNYILNQDAQWKYYSGTQAFDHHKVLKQSAQELIEDATWYLGAFNVDPDTGGYSTYSSDTLTTPVVYANERGNQNGKLCSSGSGCNDRVTRTLTWTGKVGLIYASDFLYATSGSSPSNRNECLNYRVGNYYDISGCKENNWLNDSYLYAISPAIHSYGASYVAAICNGGYVKYYSAQDAYPIKPVVFLKSDAKFDSGTGEKDDPYRLTI